MFSPLLVQAATNAGLESRGAPPTPVMRLVAPGPVVARHTPGVPGKPTTGIGHHSGGPFVPRGHELDLRVVEDRVGDREGLPARDPESMTHTQRRQQLNSELATGHLFGYAWSFPRLRGRSTALEV
jgi:hypothetical protein